MSKTSTRWAVNGDVNSDGFEGDGTMDALSEKEHIDSTQNMISNTLYHSFSKHNKSNQDLCLALRRVQGELVFLLPSWESCDRDRVRLLLRALILPESCVRVRARFLLRSLALPSWESRVRRARLLLRSRDGVTGFVRRGLLLFCWAVQSEGLRLLSLDTPPRLPLPRLLVLFAPVFLLGRGRDTLTGLSLLAAGPSRNRRAGMGDSKLAARHGGMVGTGSL